MKLALGAMFWPLLCGFVAAVIVLMALSRRQAVEPEATPAATAQEGPLSSRLLPAPFEHGLLVSHAILAATIVVLLACRRDGSQTVKSLFEGTGHVDAQVISLVVTASCFSAGMPQVDLTENSFT
jgi:hypothetical protein